MTAGRFVNLDTVMMDMVLRVDDLPARGGDAEVFERLVTTGGGFNVMAAAARQGVPTLYAGLLGEGPFAKAARSDLSREGILTPLNRGGLDLGLCIVLLEPSGERTFVTSPGAEQKVTAEELERIELRAGDVMYVSGYNFVYPSLRDQVLAWWPSIPEGVIVAFDPGPRVSDIDVNVLGTVLQRTDWILLNDEEATALCRDGSAEERATELAGRVRSGCVIHRGDTGCVVAIRGEGVSQVPAVLATVVDTNGAGDTHNGVFLSSLALGRSPLEAAHRANYAASVAIGRLGPAQCPPRDDVEAWYRAFSDSER